MTEKKQNIQSIFTEIYNHNLWRNKGDTSGSRSGHGSDLGQTRIIRPLLPDFLKEHSITSILDIPCGDFYWMKEVDINIDYTGADIVSDVIDSLNSQYKNSQRRFVHLDIIEGTLPKVDLVFVRDLLVHFPFEAGLKAIENIKRSGSKYLLTTTFVNTRSNFDIQFGQWRPINLQKDPYLMPPPIDQINEGCTESDPGCEPYFDKTLALYKIN